jgi:hypothetical protein
MSVVEQYQLKLQELSALKKAKPYLSAKLDAQINFYKSKIQQIRNSYPRKLYGDKPAPTASTVTMGEMDMNNNHPVSKYLMQQKQMLTNNLKQLEVQMNKEANQLKNLQAQGNQVPTAGPKTMQHNLMSVAAKLRPGNLGDINQVVWPFWFTTGKATLAPNTTVQSNITITQEAAFIWLGHTKATFLKEAGSDTYQYIDPEQPDSAGKANNLTMSIRDSQSSRTFMNKSIDLNQVGTWKYPTILPTPQLLLPNSNIEFQFANSDQNNTYRPWITIYGLRVRIEDAKNILSTISS